MNYIVRDSQLLKEIIKRKPIYNVRADPELRERCWLEVVEALSPPGYSELEKKKLETYLRRSWSKIRTLLMYYFTRFYDLVSEVVGLYDSSFDTKVLIYKYMCTRVSSLVKYFMLNEADFDDFQNYFDTHINAGNAGVPQPNNRSAHNESAAKDSVATQTEFRQLDTSTDQPHIENSDSHEGFITNLNKELLKLPEEAKLRMENEIMELVRRGQQNSRSVLNQQTTISLLKDLLDETVSFQYNLLNVQLEQLSQIKQHLEHGNPQSGPSSIISPPRPQRMYVEGNQISMGNKAVPIRSATLANDPSVPAAAAAVNELNVQSRNVNEPNCSNSPQNDVDMGDQSNFPPPNNQDCNQFNDIPVDDEEQNYFKLPPNNGTKRNRPNTSRNNPYIQRNEDNMDIHLCDEFILFIANSVLYAQLDSSNNPHQGVEASSVPGPISTLPINRKRSASETYNLSSQSPNQSRNLGENVTSSSLSNTSANLEPSSIYVHNPIAGSPENSRVVRNMCPRRDVPSTSKSNYTL